MEIWVNLEFGDGDFQKGFIKIQLKIDDFLEQNQSSRLEAQLPPAHEIPTTYELWKNIYYSLLPHPKRGFKDHQITNVSINTCDEYAQYLQKKLNQWLQPIQSQLESVITSNPDTEIR